MTLITTRETEARRWDPLSIANTNRPLMLLIQANTIRFGKKKYKILCENILTLLFLITVLFFVKLFRNNFQCGEGIILGVISRKYKISH